ncbi:phosphoenolpyruvate carboxylase [Sporocytophaga myxococcoides]|uniref:Phosphoenolpyruvate carboxylase n=1 Tax=Sporocytophaga myxococcoides TaxID=153721 RepID=A0A098LH56_9BACT|nr:phosphoenolpyruvate carboxylase [Sporocytophaga myxococcoides]GAL86311.1 phosphoenolpyruvate carboxylase [Sporocytophaga myxococcoides]
MNSSANGTLQVFKNLVGTKYEMYNSLFSSLPFHKVEKTGVLLSLFLLLCEEGFTKGKSPSAIIESFLKQYTTYRTENEQTDLLFRFVQYAERQVVLFDALEDAAFPCVHDMSGPGTLKNLQAQVIHTQSQAELKDKLKDFSVRLVLTAHPTQFYPSEVLGIIHDLAKALVSDDTALVNMYLQQLGKTSFFKKEKPTPYDEAVNLIWFLENVFYHSAGKILSFIKGEFPTLVSEGNALIRMGFWPGGDRDGNPFVKSETSLKVAETLRESIIKCYYMDVRRLKRRLTFKGVENVLADLEKKLYNNLFIPGHKTDLNKEGILEALYKIKDTLVKEHNGLFVNLVDNFLSKVHVFGLFFASLDIRQDSSVHGQLLDFIAEQTDHLPEGYKKMSDDDKISALMKVKGIVDPSIIDNDLLRDTLDTMSSIKTIQKINGEEGCHRYIISHSTSALNVMEVYALLTLSGWKAKSMTIDIVPLFETIEDLRNAAAVMKDLYENKIYQKHLEQRNNIQTIMLGFSDGTKDGGYMMANWSIYKAKEELTLMAKEYGIQVAFFDGRGGPPARGGGKTHQFYASMGKNIANKEIQLTVQGQTISSNFGTTDSALFNMEQLLHAGISNALFSTMNETFTEQEDELMQLLSDESFKAYSTLKNDPNFLEYLNFASPLRYYAETNIGSRPSKRKAGKLNLNDLRAVPYVGAWSQLKQNLPGYYGVGTAFEKMEKAGRWKEVKNLYEKSLFFKTLLNNCEMAMKKCFFPLTAYLSKHPKYGSLWNMIHDEFERTSKYILKLTGSKELMGDKPMDLLSIQMRQRIELPLITIQQHALTKIREMEEKGVDGPLKKTYENMVMRCSFGIINAERNSA